MPLMTLARAACVISLVLTFVVLAGCGQKGPLTLVSPQLEPSEALATGTPTDEEASEEEESSGNDP